MLWFETSLLLQNIKIKMSNLIKQRCIFGGKIFYNAHVNVHGVKVFILNNVWLLLSMHNTSFCIKLVFTVTM
ncbi:hypothetical protein AB205_0076770, partial [Aquarana catesbeiana]